eukprot:scaffold10030_cov285-Amphora_coffeaeformis.AAC.3
MALNKFSSPDENKESRTYAYIVIDKKRKTAFCGLRIRNVDSSTPTRQKKAAQIFGGPLVCFWSNSYPAIRNRASLPPTNYHQPS